MKIARYDSLSHPITETHGNPDHLPGPAGRGVAGAQGRDAPAGHPHERPGRWTSARCCCSTGFLVGTADPMRKFSDVFARLQRAMAASDRIFDRLDRAAAGPRPGRARALARGIAASWSSTASASSTSPGQPVLEEIDLRIPFGETIAIVGPNGCGKSTLANLIPRFADPTHGVIRLDGVPLTDVRLRDLRGQIGLVTQEPLLFDDTVYNNIRYGRPRASRDEVIEAAKQAHAHRFIEKRTAAGLRHGGRHAGRPALRRPAAAHRAGPGHPPRPGHPHPRRGHQPGRPGKRAGHPGGPGDLHPQPHHDHHHPPPGRSFAGRPDRGHAGRADRRRGHARRDDGPLRRSTAGCTSSSSRTCGGSRDGCASISAPPGRRSSDEPVLGQALISSPHVSMAAGSSWRSQVMRLQGVAEAAMADGTISRIGRNVAPQRSAVSDQRSAIGRLTADY